MNDPHVDELIYRIKHAASVDYKAASALEHDHPDFSIKIDNGTATVTPKEHHATEESARATVEPFLKAWELSSALDNRDRFEFEFQNANVVDRRPTPAIGVFAGVGAFGIAGSIADLRIGKSAYPSPPIGLSYNTNVELMHHVYRLYCEGDTVISHAAYYCLTELMHAAGGDYKKTSAHFGISVPVLLRLGTLSSEKGGKEGRKAEAARSDYTPEERAWLERAMKIVIRRAAEVAYNPKAAERQITMDDI